MRKGFEGRFSGERQLQILVDADGCPVVDVVIRCARAFAVPVLLLCDSAHRLAREGAQTITVDKGADSADFALVNCVRPGDVVVTQDYGLAALCLARRATVLHQNGFVYDEDNIDSLLMARHTAKKIRRGGGRLRGPAPRTKRQDADFERCLRAMLERAGGAN